MKTVLFISHDASRTGAPIYLLTLLQFFHLKKSFHFELLLLKGGELEGEFSKLCRVYRIADEKIAKSFIKKAWRKIFPPKRALEKIRFPHYDIIYSNTLINGEAVEYFRFRAKCKIIVHVHELELTLSKYNREVIEKSINNSNCFLCVSESVKQNLINSLGVKGDKTFVVYGFLPLKVTENALNISESFSNRLNDTFNVLAVGTPQWLKGMDLFFQTALQTFKIIGDSKKIRFTWLGGNYQYPEFKQLMHDIKKSGLQDYISLIPHTNNPYNNISKCDLLFLSSREDSFPLVILEAAYYKKPVICFDKSGGTVEFLDGFPDLIIPYSDTVMAANRIRNFYENPEECISIGKKLHQKVMDNYTIDRIAPKILHYINNA